MEFQRWRRAAPEHAAAYAATERLWQSLGELAGRPEIEQLSRQILADTAERPRRLRRRFAIAAAVLIALLGGAARLAVRDSGPPAVVYATEPGKRSNITLADGSLLVLNYATEIDVRLGDRSRRVTLRKGEALFTVAHDPARPFTVVAGDGEVTALGTRFQVRNEGGHVAVTLLDGRVTVDRRDENEHAVLKPGNQVRFAVNAPEIVRRAVDPQVVASWTTGRLRFRDTPLAEAIDEVNRYSTAQIRVSDPALVGIPVSGTFEIGDSGSFVSALDALLSIRATLQGEGEILLHR